MGISKKATKNSEYTLTYANMRGVDFSANTTSDRSRFAYLENMYKDYEGNDSGIIESIPGYRVLYSFPNKICGIYSHVNAESKRVVLVHAKNELYRFLLEEKNSSLSPTKLTSTLADTKSAAVCDGSDIYILDGKSFARVSGDGTFSFIGEGLEKEPYVPTTYINGEEYEQRNLLTEAFTEEYRIYSTDKLIFGSEGLKYKVLSEEEGTCAVIGAEDIIDEHLEIPAYKMLGSKIYKVTEVGNYAFFQNGSIVSVKIAPGVQSIKDSAFACCERLVSVTLSDTVELLDFASFYQCEMLSYFYLGTGVKKIGEYAFEMDSNLWEIEYGGEIKNASRIEGIGYLGESIALREGTPPSQIKLEIPVFSPAESISSVELDGTAVDATFKLGADGIIKSAVICGEDRFALEGKTVTLRGRTSPTKFNKGSSAKSFLEEHGISGAAAICGCTLCESFDGRIFLSGNPALPNTVFYSQRNRTGKNDSTYFGIYNYFNDGIASYKATTLLATSDGLAVFKSGDDGGGSIYYHTPKETGIDILPKIYPVSYIHNGLCAKGPSISFFDDPVFLCPLGLCALEKQNINLQRSIAIRSHNVNAKLLCEDLSNASLAVWCGYLVVMTGKNIYLADSRAKFVHETNNTEYEWFYLTEIGSYSGDKVVYRYSSRIETSSQKIKEGCLDEIVTSPRIVSATSGTRTYYTSIEGGSRYSVYKTEEKTGGTFYPATVAHSVDEKYLLFGTENGALCIFNNDMRSIPPESLLSQNPLIDRDESYIECYSNRIHPLFYNFASHAPTYALITPSDNCSLPHLSKSTVKKSLAIKIKSYGADIFLEAKTDNNGYSEICHLPCAPLDFSHLNFSTLSFSDSDSFTLLFSEKEKKWVEKQLCLYSKTVNSPFGIYSLSYRFTVTGKIKHN